jgi:hypothetical protein
VAEACRWRQGVDMHLKASVQFLFHFLPCVE